MKTVLLFTTEKTHRRLYEPGLKKHFAVELTDKATRRAETVDAIVYDISTLHSTIDIRWLKSIDLPVVVLTCENALRIPRNPKQRILMYPVRMGQIIEALAELGVEASEDC